MRRKDITRKNARAAAREGELAAVVFCRDKYRWLAEHGDGVRHESLILAGTCALCHRHALSSYDCLGCPLHKRFYDQTTCCALWRRVQGHSLYDESFRAACAAMADELDRIAARLRAETPSAT